MRPLRYLVSAGVWLIAFGLYATTSAPSIVELFDDSLEFQLVGPTFGIAHPTGYPLYVILGGLWTRLLPVGSWAGRMNLLSALYAAAAVWLLFELARRLVTDVHGRPSGWAGVAAAVTFGLGPVWWAQATIAEVYTLHGLVLAAVMTVAVGINRHVVRAVHDTPTTFTPAFDRRMTWLALVVGLGLAHHRTTVLILPGLIVYLLWSVPGLWRPRPVWAIWLAALGAPLLLYLFIPLRAYAGVSDLNGSYVNSWSGFWTHVLARGYGVFFTANAPAASRTWSDWLALLQGQAGLPGLMLSLLGLTWLVDRNGRPAKAWFFVLIVLLTNLLFALNYRVGDVEVFFLPVLFCIALFAGAGVGWVGRWTASRGVVAIAQFGLILLVAAGLVGDPGGGISWVDRSRDWATHNYAVAMAKVEYPAGSRVVGLEGEMTALRYMQLAEGLGVNAEAVVADDPDRRRALVEQLLAEGTPTYLTRELSGLEGRYSFSGEGPLVRVWPRGESRVGTPAQALDILLPDTGLRVEGQELTLLDQPGDPSLRVTIYWRPTGPVESDYKVSLRLLGDDGAQLIDSDGVALVVDRYPLRQVAPTSLWLPAELVKDVYLLPISDDAAALEIVVYDAYTIAETGRWRVDLTPLMRQP